MDSLSEFRAAQERLNELLGDDPSKRDLALMEAAMDVGRLWHETAIHAPIRAVLESPERERQVAIGRRKQQAVQGMVDQKRSDHDLQLQRFAAAYQAERNGGLSHNQAIVRAGIFVGRSERQAKRYAKDLGLESQRRRK